MDLNDLPFHHRVRHHVARAAGVCDEWCREARMYDRVLPAAFLLGVLAFLLYVVTIAAPLNFPSGTLLKIPQGMNVAEAGALLKEHHIIHSTLLFEAAGKLEGKSSIVAGEYFFDGPQNVFIIAHRLAEGDHELTPIKVRIPEGASTKEITALLRDKIPDFDADMFYSMAAPHEGKLFPDTYFFLPGEDADLVLSAFENNFNQQLKDPALAAAIAKFGKPLNEVLTMASILEKEASDLPSRQMISGILWHRISLGMALQVDAAFLYINGVNSFDLTKADLKNDSPYNTYTHKGLPPGPIDNPSTQSILAAVTPTKSNYLFYLSDLQSNLHYCATYSCQQANARKYLGN